MSPLFFIDRPKFAFVISILITLAGLLSLLALPVAQYPDITPPQVSVTASYPGASAEVVEKTVAGPIEAQVNGVDDMIYMSSRSGNDGSYTLNVSFDIGSDPDMNTVNVQNRVQLATSQLPDEVTRQGVSVTKQSTNMLLVINLTSPNGTYDSIFLSNYASINIRDAMSRINGVGKAEILGARDYGMRLWLDPNRMTSLGVTPSEVISAVQDQNVQVAAGQIGAPPNEPGTLFQYTIQTQGRLDSVDEFEDIIVRANNDGSVITIGDIATVELGAQSYTAISQLNGKPAVTLAIYQSPGANALAVAEQVQATLNTLAERFPEDVEAKIVYDSTRFVTATIDEVVKTLFEAFFLVAVVVFVFLQDWRATLIPIIAIPVSLIGTFAVMAIMGFSINTVTLFGMILAIGLVVDDAIVVLENVQHMMSKGMAPREATKAAMKQVTGPIVATTLVLGAVFVPVAFMPGITGQMYQQFAVTIAVSVFISGINALTLAPALCVSFLRGEKHYTHGPLGWFNRAFDAGRRGYVGLVRRLVRHLVLGIGLLLILYGGTGWMLLNTPTGFIPEEDQGYFIVDIQLPEGASLNRSAAVVDDLEQMLMEFDGVADVITVTGYSMISQGVSSNSGMAIVVLKPWDQREGMENSVWGIMMQAYSKMSAMSAANVIPFNPPAIPGLGTTGGFEFVLQDYGGRPAADLAAVMGGLIYAANNNPVIANTFSTFKADQPQLWLDVDREKAKVLGVDISTLFTTLQTYLGSMYVNDFNLYGRVYKVMLQAGSAWRSQVSDIDRIYVRNQDGEMVPLRTLATIDPILGPQAITRYNMFNSATINGSAAPGYSSGESIQAMEQVANETLPQGYGFEWTGMALQEIQSGDTAPLVFALALIFVYLFLVAQYESWSIPLSILLYVPIAVGGALIAVQITGLSNNLYTQIGLVTLIGLSAKNAILIVEFAKEKRDEGLPLREAAATAANLRFRAVLMTAFAFILGMVPMLMSSGAGAVSRISLGSAMFSGMLVASTIGITVIPTIFVIFQGLREKVKGIKDPAPTDDSPDGKSPVGEGA